MSPEQDWLVLRASQSQPLSEGERERVLLLAQRAARSGGWDLQARALTLLAQDAHRRGISVSAEELLTQVLSLRRRHSDVAGEIRALCNIALVFQDQGDMNQALSHLTQAQQRLSSSQTPLVSELYVRSNLGSVTEHLGRLSEAAGHYKRAYEVAQETGDLVAMAAMSLNAGEIERKLGKPDMAGPLLNSALDAARQLDLGAIEVATLHSLGMMALEHDDAPGAARLLSQAQREATRLGDVDAQLSCLEGLARVALKLGQTRAAHRHLLRAAEMADTARRPEVSCRVHLLLAQVYERRRPRRSIVHLREAARLEAHLRDAALAAQARDLTLVSDLSLLRREMNHERQLRQVSEQARQVAEAKVQASFETLEQGRLTDELTGLPNRLMLHGLLDRACDTARRRGEVVMLAVIDLVDFRKLNDLLGYPAGDLVLRASAERLSAILVPGAELTVARSSGDEFVLLLSGPLDAQAAALQLSATLSAVFAEPFGVAGQALVVGASVGLASFPRDADHDRALLRAAHAALGEARTSGVPVIYSGQDARSVEQLVFESELALALDRGEFELHYQPLVDAHSLAVIKAEALLRWRSARLGLVGPGDFIPLLERGGLIVPVGTWVLREACRAALTWGDVRVTVNLSVKQLMQPDFYGLVCGVLAETGLAPDHLELEITEGLVMHSPERVRPALQALRGLGVKVSLDDFGTGYSNLAALSSFPLDVLKIDRSLVQNLDSGGMGEAIIGVMVDLCRALRLTSVAEGVETQAQAQALSDLGVQVFQGYLYGRPQLGWVPEGDIKP